MKTKILTLSILSLLSITSVFAQDRTTVTANNSEISDNLDLRAVASIFGDSENLQDFERRLNDPKTQISNLDLNEDNQVDYLRVIETIEGNAHLIVIQSVLGRDVFQDVATIEVERDSNNRVQVQVVGDVYMYGANYIYEPVYSFTPVIYTSFWIGGYHPYYSSWYWGYYPTYYYAWTPYPVYRYRTHIGVCINVHHNYNYVNYRRCQTAYNSYRGKRGNGYEARYPNRSFEHRNASYANRYELDKTRNIRTVGTRNETAYNSPRNSNSSTMAPRGNATPRNNSPKAVEPRSTTQNGNSPRAYSEPRTNTPRATEPRGNNQRVSTTVSETPRAVRTQEAAPRAQNQRAEAPRAMQNQRAEAPRSSAPQRESNSSSNARESSGQRGNSQGGSRR